MESGYNSAQYVTRFLHEALREVAAIEKMTPTQITTWEALDRRERGKYFDQVLPEAASKISKVNFTFPVEIWDQEIILTANTLTLTP